MNRLSSVCRARRMAALLAAVVLAVVITRADAAYRILRPIAIGIYGYILQTNLYGEDPDGDGIGHKGIDFPAVVDTSVYAVADGVVRQVKEDGADNCSRSQCGWFGNFILVRHNQPHYDRTTRQQAYVYALYAHLSYNGANVNVNDPVSAGQDIGDVDNTGNSFGNHLHLQIMLDPDPNRIITDIQHLTWAETTSRNPELWLTPYNGTTGTVVGKITNTNGDPVGGRYMCGLQKQAGWGYLWSLTYNYPNINPDDILVENWGTTDVTPGTYAVNSCVDSSCTSCISMGTHTVEAGKITYVGLFPVWLPYILGNWGGWNSTIYVRNNSGTYRAQVNTTFFNTDGTVRSQRTDYINTNATLALVPPTGFTGTAIVVSSEDVAVAAMRYKTGGVDADNGFAATGSSAFERTGTTLYAPAIYANIYNINSSTLRIMNTGTATANVTLYFKGRTGYSDATRTATIPTNGRYTLDANTVFASPWVGSVKLTSDQLVAFKVYDVFADGSTRTSNAAAGGSTVLYGPAVYRAAYSLTSGVVVQNIGSSSTTVTLEFYNRDGSLRTTYSLGAIGAERAAGVYLASVPGLPDGWAGSVRIVSSGQSLVAMVTTDRPAAGIYAYNAPSSPTRTVYIPRAAKNANGRTTSYVIQNASTGTTLQVTATYYDTSGAVRYQTSLAQLPPKGSAGYWQGGDPSLPDGWEGSILLQANYPWLVAMMREDIGNSLGGATGIGR